MNIMKFLKGMNNVSAKYIMESDPTKVTRKSIDWGKWSAIAACLCVAVVLTVIYLSQLQDDLPVVEETSVSGEMLADDSSSQMIEEQQKIYYEKCTAVSIQNMLQIPYVIDDAMVGEQVAYVHKSDKFDYEMTEELSEIELLSLNSFQNAGIYLVNTAGEYETVILCNIGEKGLYALAGEERPAFTVNVSDAKLQLPKAEIVGFYGKTAGTRTQLLDLSEQEMLDIVSEMENAENISLDQAANPNRHMYGCSISLILLDEERNQIGLSMTPFDDGFVGVSIGYENKNYWDQDSFIFLKSMELVNCIKEYAGWKAVAISDLNGSSKIVCRNSDMEYVLSDSERKWLITALAQATPVYVDTKCPFDVEVAFQLDDGSLLHGLWCNDSCRYLAVEGVMYLLSEENYQMFIQIIQNMEDSSI